MFEQKNRVVERMEVEVRTLDKFVRELMPVAAPGRVFVKLDTQGFDLAVLEGAKGTIARYRRDPDRDVGDSDLRGRT